MVAADLLRLLLQNTTECRVCGVWNGKCRVDVTALKKMDLLLNLSIALCTSIHRLTTYHNLLDVDGESYLKFI
ncbi:hypothetical protein PUN28_013080 [Cardiocondyla obscurior]|uniref:Uncharacterized protein n=1 Tax=Cardiocondyla obscurior TaxID=286306 RepID=A0AAW2FAX4_9HYME